MAWSSPRTWVTAEIVTAAQMNTDVRNNLAALNPDDTVNATSFTPNLEATTTNPNNAEITTTGREWRVGPMQFVLVLFAMSGTFSDPDQGSGTYFVTLPAAASGVITSATSGSGQAVGSWNSRDNSTANNESGAVQLRSATTVVFNRPVGTIVTDSSPFTWAADDVLSFYAVYPVA